MKKRLLTDMNVNPTDALLRNLLGSAFQYYESILHVSGGFRRQWQFSRGNGWLLKVDDTRKALYYLIAFEEGIEISLTVRDAERQSFLDNPTLQNLHAQLESSIKYAEGYALRFGVESSADCGNVAEFIKALIEQRGSAPAPRKKASRAKSAPLRGENAKQPKAKG